jgi:uncharacterized membrane protein
MSQGLTRWFPKSRLEALSDGIYAVALTLLVLDLKLPAGSLDPPQFTQLLVDQASNALTWLLSFWVIVIFWQSRVELIRCVDRIGQTYVQLELVHLALISLLPFSTSLIGEHSEQPLSFLIYTSNLWLISLLGLVQVFHIQKNKNLITGESGVAESATESETLKPSVSATEIASQVRGAKLMFIGVSVALLLVFVAPGWNLLAILLPKLLLRR